MSEIMLVTLTNKEPNPRTHPIIKMPLLIRQELKDIPFPTFKKIIFQIVARDVYKDYIHIFADGKKNPETGNT